MSGNLRAKYTCSIIFKNKFQDLHEAQEKLSKLLPKSQTVIDTIPVITVYRDQFLLLNRLTILRRYFSINSSSYLTTSFSRFRNERHEILKSCLARIARVLRSSPRDHIPIEIKSRASDLQQASFQNSPPCAILLFIPLRSISVSCK